MPGNVGEFSVKVTADLTDFKSKMDEVKQSITDLSSVFEEYNRVISGSTETVNGNLTNFANTVTNLNQSVTQLSTGFTNLTNVTKGIDNLSGQFNDAKGNADKITQGIDGANQSTQTLNRSATDVVRTTDEMTEAAKRHGQAVAGSAKEMADMQKQQQAMADFQTRTSPEEMSSRALGEVLNTEVLQMLWSNVIFGNSGLFGKIATYALRSLVTQTKDYSQALSKLSPEQQASALGIDLATYGGKGGYAHTVGGSGGMNFGMGGGSGGILLNALLMDLMGGGGKGGKAISAAETLATPVATTVGSAAEKELMNGTNWLMKLGDEAQKAGYGIEKGAKGVESGASKLALTTEKAALGTVEAGGNILMKAVSGVGGVIVKAAAGLAGAAGLTSVGALLGGTLGTAIAPIVGTLALAAIGALVTYALENFIFKPIMDGIEYVGGVVIDVMEDIIAKGSELQEATFKLGVAYGDEGGQYMEGQANQISNRGSYDELEIMRGMYTMGNVLGGTMGDADIAKMSESVSKMAAISGAGMEGMSQQVSMGIMYGMDRQLRTLRSQTGVDLTNANMQKMYGKDAWKDMSDEEKRQKRIEYFNSPDVQNKMDKDYENRLDTINGQLMLLQRNQKGVGEWFRDFGEYAVAPMKLLNGVLDTQNNLMEGMAGKLKRWADEMLKGTDIKEKFSSITGGFTTFNDVMSNTENIKSWQAALDELEKKAKDGPLSPEDLKKREELQKKITDATKENADVLANMDPLQRRIYDLLVKVENVWERITRVIGMAMTVLKELWNDILEPIVKNIGNKLLGVFDSTMGSVGNLADAVWRLLGYIAMFISLVYGDGGNGMSKEKKATIIDTVKNDIEVMINYIGTALTIKLAEIVGNVEIWVLGQLAHMGVDIVNGTWTLIQASIAAIATALGIIIVGIIQLVANLWDGIIDIMKIAGNVWIDIIGGLASAILNIFYGLEKGVANIVGSMADNLVNGIGAAIAKLDSGGVLSKALRAVGQGQYADVLDNLKAQNWHGGSDWASNLNVDQTQKNAQDKLADIMSNAKSIYSGFFDSFKIDISGFVQDSTDFLEGIWNWVGNAPILNHEDIEAGIQATYAGNAARASAAQNLAYQQMLNGLTSGNQDAQKWIEDWLADWMEKWKKITNPNGDGGTPTSPDVLPSAIDDLTDAVNGLNDTVDQKKMDVKINLKIVQTFEGKVTEQDLIDASKSTQETIEKTLAKYPALAS